MSHDCLHCIDIIEAQKRPALGLIKLFEIIVLYPFFLPFSLQAFYAFSGDILARKERFEGGLDRELALFEEMKARIQNLEEQLNLAP